MFKRFISMLLCICMAVSVATPVLAEADDVTILANSTEYSGSFDDTFSWKVNLSDNSLTINGIGVLPNEWIEDAPWLTYSAYIEKVYIENGITELNGDLFDFCFYIEFISIPKSVININNKIFFSCVNLKEINVDKDNPYYYSVDGVLYMNYSTDKSMVFYPKGIDNQEFTIPDGITKIERFAFWGSFNKDITEKLEIINIPASLRYFENMIDLHIYPNLKQINVDSNNLYLCSVDNVIYNKDMTELLFYNFNKPDTVFYIPDGVKIVNKSILYSALNLCELYIPSSVEVFIHNVFLSNESELENIHVDNMNEKFCSIDGVLFNKDKTELIYYPSHNKRTYYEIPKTVNKLLTDSFYNTQKLNKLIIPESIDTIEYGAIITGNITEIYFCGDVPTNYGSYLYYAFVNMKPECVLYYPHDNKSGWTSPTWTAPDGYTYNTAPFNPDELKLPVKLTIIPGTQTTQTKISWDVTSNMVRYELKYTDNATGKIYNGGSGTLTGYNTASVTIPQKPGTYTVTLNIEYSDGEILTAATETYSVIYEMTANSQIICTDPEDYAGNYRDFTVTFDSLPTGAYLQFDDQFNPNAWLSDEYCSTNPAFIIDTTKLVQTETGYQYKTTFIIHSEGLAYNSYLRKVRVAIPTASGVTYSEPFSFHVYPVPETPQNKIGYAYAQTLDIPDNITLPEITAVIAAKKNGYYRLTIATYKCDDNADVFFYWEADAGEFQKVNDDFSVVDFIPDGNNTITVHMGDGLGYVAEYVLKINE